MPAASMPRVAFVTYEAQPELCDDDRLTADLLRRRNIEIAVFPWTAANVDWLFFDLVIIRSPWDYHLKPAAYQKWIENFQIYESKLCNPPAAILGNLNKKYLLDLAATGVPVIPTLYFPSGSSINLKEQIAQKHWDNIIVKPAISAGARDTWQSHYALADEHQARFADQLQTQDVLIQPYLSEIATQGEWSIIFFNGEYSHAVLKKPVQGDFRVQEKYGGQAASQHPSSILIDQARSILDYVKEPLLYARIDGIETEQGFLLMELEINEPSLFLSHSEGASRRFANAILAKLESL